MKKTILLPLLFLISIINFYAHNNFEINPNKKDFAFSEYSENLFIEQAIEEKCDGCFADCGTSSCAGSGCCTCSCSTFECKCEPNDKNPDPIGYTEPKINISINKNQYENLKKIAFILYEAKDENANQAYLHLGNVIKSLKEKNAIEFHKNKESYFNSLARITDPKTKIELNNFFQEIGVIDRV